MAEQEQQPEEKKVEEKKAEEKGKVDVTKWVYSEVRWADLPRNYVSAYLKHQFNMVLPDEHPGVTFKELYNNSSPAGKRVIGEKIGLRRAANAKLKVELTRVQRDQIIDDIVENCKVKDLVAQVAAKITLPDILRTLDEKTAQVFVDMLIKEDGYVSHLVSFFSTDEEELASVLVRLLDTNANKDPAKIFKKAILTSAEYVWGQEGMYDTWLANYAKVNEIKLLGEIKETDPWAPTWRDVEQKLLRTPIVKGNPQRDEYVA